MSMREVIFFSEGAGLSQRQSRNRVGSAGSGRSKGPSEQWQWTRPGLFVELATKQGEGAARFVLPGGEHCLPNPNP